MPGIVSGVPGIADDDVGHPLGAHPVRGRWAAACAPGAPTNSVDAHRPHQVRIPARPAVGAVRPAPRAP
jgi:hypothetical protein